MERIKLNLPEAFTFNILLNIRITDLNYGGHVGNDSFLSLVHEARQQFLLYHHYSEMNVEGVALIMADAAIEFKRELSFNQQIRIWVTATGFDKLGFDFYYKIEVLENMEWLLAGKAKTGMLCFDYNEKKKISVPARAIQKFMAA